MGCSVLIVELELQPKNHLKFWQASEGRPKMARLCRGREVGVVSAWPYGKVLSKRIDHLQFVFQHHVPARFVYDEGLNFRFHLAPDHAKSSGSYLILSHLIDQNFETSKLSTTLIASLETFPHKVNQAGGHTSIPLQSRW